MDECRFDNWTRLLAGGRDRRTALKSLAGAGVALISLARADLGLAAQDDVLVEGCRLTGDSCDKNNQCCSGDCRGAKKRKRNRNGKRKRRSGECRCLGNNKSCTKDAACCRGFCDRSDNRCRCSPEGDLCNVDNDCCKGTCRTDRDGRRYCNRDRRNRRRRNRR